MKSRVWGVGFGLLVAVACGKEKPRSDSTAAMAPPDTVRAATGGVAAPDFGKAAPDTVGKSAATKTQTKASTKAAAKQAPIIGRDSVIIPGPNNPIKAIPTIADTAKKKPPR